MSGFSVIGKRNRKVDGRRKVTGQAIFTDDLQPARLLHGKLLRSPHAHARIRAIDASRALALPGVHAVITGRDLPVALRHHPLDPRRARAGHRQGALRRRRRGRGGRRRRADRRGGARAHRRRLRGAPGRPHRRGGAGPPRDPGQPAGRPARGTSPSTSCSPSATWTAGWPAADVVVEDTWFHAGSTHAAIEPHCAIGDLGRRRHPHRPLQHPGPPLPPPRAERASSPARPIASASSSRRWAAASAARASPSTSSSPPPSSPCSPAGR